MSSDIPAKETGCPEPAGRSESHLAVPKLPISDGQGQQDGQVWEFGTARTSLTESHAATCRCQRQCFLDSTLFFGDNACLAGSGMAMMSLNSELHLCRQGCGQRENRIKVILIAQHAFLYSLPWSHWTRQAQFFVKTNPRNGNG